MLEAAIAVIEERGEAGLRVDEIAAAAEVAKPSLYHFFGSRDGLIAAAQAERYRRTRNIGLDEVMRKVEACTSADQFAEIIRLWVVSFSSEEASRRRAVRLEVLGSSVSRPELRAEVLKSSDQANEGLVELVRFATSRGWALQSVDIAPEAVALWLEGLWNGRYLVEAHGDPALVEDWDNVTTTALFRLLFGSD
ncbi:MAG: TetR/AcrR family transcriptional regulator [Acidimicrobiia bacterium]|nr:TetR/AcrR family transcriptional regulator [Acidimicrobiia bacterium]